MTTCETFESANISVAGRTVLVKIEGNSCYLSFMWRKSNYNDLCIPTNLLFEACIRLVFPELPVAETNGFYRMGYWRNSWLECSYKGDHEDFITERFGIDSSATGVYIIHYTIPTLNELKYMDILVIEKEDASILLSLITESRKIEHDKN